jgi:hypothetical protein
VRIEREVVVLVCADGRRVTPGTEPGHSPSTGAGSGRPPAHREWWWLARTEDYSPSRLQAAYQVLSDHANSITTGTIAMIDAANSWSQFCS